MEMNDQKDSFLRYIQTEFVDSNQMTVTAKEKVMVRVSHSLVSCL